MEGDDADDDYTTLVSLLNAVMYTAQNESEACLLGECIFSQQRERERKREKVFRVLLLLLLLREGDDDQYIQT